MDDTIPRERRATWGLLAAAALTVIIWQVPAGSLALYPFTLLATFYHETGHALAGLLCGLKIGGISIYANGSGLAHATSGGPWLSRVCFALGGPFGPALVGAALIAASRWPRLARAGLASMAAAMLLVDLVWIRSVTGFVVIGLMGAGLGWLALRGSQRANHFALQFLGVQACISVFAQIGYLFTREATIGGQVRVSDTGILAQLTLIPHFIWAAAIIGVSLSLLLTSLRLATRRVVPAKTTAGASEPG